MRSLKGYDFTSEAGTFTNRFQLILRDPTLSNEEFTNEKAVIYINQNEDILYVKDLFNRATQLSFLNMLGQTVTSYNGISNQTLEKGINISDLNSGVYVVSIKTDDITINKKVLIN